MQAYVRMYDFFNNREKKQVKSGYFFMRASFSANCLIIFLWEGDFFFFLF